MDTLSERAGEARTEADFASFYEQVEPRLRAALTSRYGEAGRDAAAAALAWAYEHQDRVRALDDPVGYLYRVGQSKHRRRREGVPTVVRQLDLPDVEPGLAPALSALPTRQRQVVLLVHGHGWTLAEVARTLELGKSTVQTHLERGMASLRERLGAT